MTPPRAPPRIRTDATNAFAHYTMTVRVPGILHSVIERNPDYPVEVRERIADLSRAVQSNQPLPELTNTGPHHEAWLAALTARAGETWLGTDWFFAENYLYRLVVDDTAFWSTRRDPFGPFKLEEYRSRAHHDALEAGVRLTDEAAEPLNALLLASLFGNRIDLSLAAARARGVAAESEDLLRDDRAPAIELLRRRTGDVHVLIDNAGTELSVDLVLVARVLSELGARVVLHVKEHPTFVSDAISADLDWHLGDGPASAEPLWAAVGAPAQRLRATLREAWLSGALQVAHHPFWNGPDALWELPPDLRRTFTGARLVLMKGDAHLRRAIGDAIWPADSSFAAVTAYFPAPLLALRTLKSDAVVGLETGQAETLDRIDPEWRVNGKRALACLGGQLE